MMEHRRAARAARTPGLALGAILLIASGCGSSGPSGKAAAVRPADFASADATPVAPPPPAPRPEPPDGPTINRTGPVAVSDGIFDVYAQIGAPPMAASDAGPVEDPKLVQAKVGDINGRAVYATEFLSPMADRLKAEAKKRKPADWMKFAEAEIRRELDLLIEDELLVAEARESLTPEQRQGFFAFLEDVRANLYSENRGSRAAANKKLFESEGVNEEQWLRTQEQKELIRFQLNQMINRKTVVTWREIQQAYERSYEVFNPDPRAFFHVIRVSNSKKEALEAMASAIERGDDFIQLAAGPANEWKSKEAGIEIRQFKGEFEKGEFFGPEKMNEAARTLKVGQWAGPIPWGSTSAWIYLEKIEQVSKSLYEVQLNLESFLRERKSEYGRKKYLQRIKARSSITDIDDMTQRLLAIAAERYLPGGAPPPAAATPAANAPRTAEAPAPTPPGSP